MLPATLMEEVMERLDASQSHVELRGNTYRLRRSGANGRREIWISMTSGMTTTMMKEENVKMKR